MGPSLTRGDGGEVGPGGGGAGVKNLDKARHDAYLNVSLSRLI